MESQFLLHKLRAARAKKQIRHCDIARALDLAENTISKTLAGDRSNPDTVLAIADYLGVPRTSIIKNGKKGA